MGFLVSFSGQVSPCAFTPLPTTTTGLFWTEILVPDLHDELAPNEWYFRCVLDTHMFDILCVCIDYFRRFRNLAVPYRTFTSNVKGALRTIERVLLYSVTAKIIYRIPAENTMERTMDRLTAIVCDMCLL